MTEMNIMGALSIIKTHHMKPNFSDLGRQYGLDRHTISQYYRDGGKKPIKRMRMSILDAYVEDIRELMKTPGRSKKAVYEYLKDIHEDIGTYSNFRSYTLKHDIKVIKSDAIHVRYETKPGVQLQTDWKEDINMTSKYGEVFHFNILSSTLGYSRQHVFEYARTKSIEDFLRCLIQTFRVLGGTTKDILTDNMSSIVTVTKTGRRKHPWIKQLEKDAGISFRFCKVRTPQTKGKVESANRFISWLKPYDGQFKDEQELIGIIKRIEYKCNLEINQTTHVPPVVLFQKEKEYLKPLPSNVMLESYVSYVDSQTVPQTLLVYHQGQEYSVPMKYVNKRVKLIPIDDNLYIYHNTELITIHQISTSRFNYHKSDYMDALKSRISKTDSDIEQMALENLKVLENIRR
jgi:transposase